MTVPADPPDAQILAEYQRRIDQGEPVPSQRRLIEAYGIGFPRARRLVEELKRRKATAALEAVQASGDGAVAALATEVIGRIHQHAVDADPVQSVQGAPVRTEGAPEDEAEPVHRTDEVDADPVQSVQGAPVRTEGAPEDEAEPVHRTDEVDADPVQSVQGAPATGEVAQQPRPANDEPSLGDHTSPGMNGRERPFRAPLGRMLTHDAVGIAARRTEAPAVPPAPGRTEGAPVAGEVSVHRTGEADADPVQSVQGAPVRTEGAPVAGEVSVHRTGEADADPVQSVQGAPVRTEGAPAGGETGAVRPGALVIVLWAVGAAVAAAAVTRAVQTPVGARVWKWLTGAVGADAAMMAGVAAGAGVLAATIGLTVHLLARFRAVRAQVERTPSAWSSRMYLVAAVVFMGLSVDTSIRFFREKVGITEWWELALVFSGMELGLLACAVAMYEAVRRDGRPPHSARMTAWGIATLAGTTGLLLGGWPGGLIRAAGPFLAMVMLHMALGIERQRTRRRDMSTAVGRVLSELQERALSWVGLSDEGRSAVVRSRQRAARRAARLALQERDEGNTRAQRKRDRELQRELAKADVVRDAEARRVFLHEVEVLRSMRSTDALVETMRQLDTAS